MAIFSSFSKETMLFDTFYLLIYSSRGIGFQGILETSSISIFLSSINLTSFAKKEVNLLIFPLYTRESLSLSPGISNK